MTFKVVFGGIYSKWLAKADRERTKKKFGICFCGVFSNTDCFLRYEIKIFQNCTFFKD